MEPASAVPVTRGSLSFAGEVGVVPRPDGAAGAVRLPGRDAITAEFVRFKEGDATCCPSSRMSVRYRIDRTGTQPVVVPADVRTTRGY